MPQSIEAFVICVYVIPDYSYNPSQLRAADALSCDGYVAKNVMMPRCS